MQNGSLEVLRQLKKVVVFLGLPGSGKGRTIDVLQELHPQITAFSTGQYFRTLAGHNDQLSMLIKQTVAAGALVSDELTFRVILEQVPLNLKDEHTHLCIDGFPRNVSQADFLMEQSLQVIAIEIGNLTDEFCLRRILNAKDRKDRTDDVEETVRRRIQLHHQVTDPVAEYFKMKYPNLYHFVDGNLGAHDRAREVEKILGLESVSEGANEAGLELPSVSKSKSFQTKPQPKSNPPAIDPRVPAFSMESVPNHVRELAQR